MPMLRASRAAALASRRSVSAIAVSRPRGSDPRIQVVPLPLLIRLPVALAVIVVAARWDRAWLLPIGVMLALPNVWTSSLALLAAVPALWPAQRQGNIAQ